MTNSRNRRKVRMTDLEKAASVIKCEYPKSSEIISKELIDSLEVIQFGFSVNGYQIPFEVLHGLSRILGVAQLLKGNK